MSNRVVHVVAGSAPFKPGAGRFERGQAIVVIAALGIGGAVFQLSTNCFGISAGLALVAGLIPPCGAVVFLIAFVTGKPRRHAADAIAWLWSVAILNLASRGVPLNPKALIGISDNELQ